MNDAEIVKKARVAANLGREYAENYSGDNPPDSVPWENADLIDKLADALEAAEAGRDAVVAMAKHDALHGFATDLMTYCLDHSTPERILTQVVGLAKRNGDMAAR